MCLATQSCNTILEALPNPSHLRNPYIHILVSSAGTYQGDHVLGHAQYKTCCSPIVGAKHALPQQLLPLWHIHTRCIASCIIQRSGYSAAQTGMQRRITQTQACLSCHVLECGSLSRWDIPAAQRFAPHRAICIRGKHNEWKLVIDQRGF